MRKLLFLFFILLINFSYSQPIKVDTKKYTVDRLVEDILFNTPCASVSNVTYKGKEGIGYFHKGKSNFPMNDGIVLTTAKAILVPGPVVNDPYSYRKDPDGGDAELLKYIRDFGIDSDLQTYNNSTIIEFDFVPITNKISFRFLFASEEYGVYQCEYADAFAFFLTNTETGARTNLALVPDTNLPISVLTIRDKQYNKGSKDCDSVNPEYFASYNENDPNSAINFNGETVIMSAKSDVEANVKYHIKLVIADRNDYKVSSAVFIEGGSFDIGMPTLGDDLTIDGANALCPGETYLLDTELDPLQYVFQWNKDGETIVGQNGPTLEVTETGLYSLFLRNKGNAMCFNEPDPILVEFFDSIVIDNQPEDLEACNVLGVNPIFNLNAALKNVTFSQVEFSFYDSKSEAEQGSSPLPSMYHLDNIQSQKEIWVRVQSSLNSCFKILSFKIKKTECELKLVDLDDLILCDTDSPLNFDIGQYSKVVYHNAPGYKVDFYKSKEDANGNSNPIPEADLSNYLGENGELIWVRVTKESEPGFFATTSFKLIVGKAPIVNEDVTPLRACADTAASNEGFFDLKNKDREVSFSISGTKISYYDTMEAAIEGDNKKALPLYNYKSVEKKIYARVELIKTGCFSVSSFDLKLVPLPKINDIGPVSVCDSNQIGFSSFNLLALRDKLIQHPIPSDYVMSFHSTIQDAELNIKPLGDKYNNVRPRSEIIYVRVSIEGTKCIVIEPIQLVVNEAPKIIFPTEYAICDLQENGIGIFDLTSKEKEILNGLEKDKYFIYYYSTQKAANIGDINEVIANPTEYTNLTSKYVWVRVVDKETQCFKIVSMKLEVNPIPSVSTTIPNFILCDNLENKGFATFNLKDKTDEITGSNKGLIVEFYETKENAESKEKYIDRDYTNTQPYKQVIFVRVEDDKTGCFVVLPLTLEVSPYPIFELPEDVITVCTQSDNEVGKFNLLSIVEGALVDFKSYEYTFFETKDNADDNFSFIKDPDNYNNLKGKHSVWVRLVNKRADCIAIYEIKLETVVVPKVPFDLETIVVCDSYEDIFDSSMTIDLTQYNNLILEGQSKDREYEITFYTSQANAEAGENLIINPKEYVNKKAEETIWVKLADKNSGCFSVGQFNIKVNIPLKLVKPSEISFCNTDFNNNSVETFDLTIRELEIIGGIKIYGVKYEYYENETDALYRVNQIKNPEAYNNKSIAQTIWVVVENQFGCVNSVVLTIRVLPLPKPNMNLNALEACEKFDSDTNLGTGKAQFNLFDIEDEIRNNDKTLKLSYFETEQNAIDNKNALEKDKEDRSIDKYFSKSRFIYIRVETTPTNAKDSCFIILKLELKVNPIPVFDNPKPFVICLEEIVEYYEFNLEEKIPEVLGKYDKDLFSVKFYIDEKSANDATSPLPLLYTNVSKFNQTIFVRLEDMATGCYLVKPMILQIENKVSAFDIESPIEFCDDNDGPNPINDGFTRIDLTSYSNDIIGEQIIDAADLMVQYFASEADLKANKPIEKPEAFVNTSSSQEIIAIVRNKDLKLYCQAEIRFTVIVNKLPVISEIEGGYICENLETRQITPFIIDTKLDSTLYDFVWEHDNTVIEGAKGPYYDATLAGNYTVNAIDKKTNCTSVSVSVLVNKVAPFMITIEEINSNLDVLSESDKQNIIVNVKSDISSTRNYEFALNDGDYQDENVFYGVEPGEHLVWVRDKATTACAFTRVVSVINYPKYFTPNGDGYNDTWNVRGLKDQPNAIICIFDRFGKLIENINPSGEGWDGTFQGRPMPATDYWFTVEYNNHEGNKQRFKGHFSLKR